MDEERTLTRRTALQSLGAAAAVGLAGCNSPDTSDPADPPTGNGTGTPTGQPTASPTETGTPTETPTQSTDHSHDHSDHSHTQSAPPDDAGFVENPEEIHPTLVEETSVPSDEVLIGYRLEDSGLPFETEVYHSPEDAEIHAMDTYDTQDLSEVPLVPDSPDTLDTVETDNEDIHYGTTEIDEPLAVTLVARYDGSSEYEWTAWRRTGYPFAGHPEEDPNLIVDCYCGGENYAVSPGETWARVIAVTPTDRVDTGTTVALNWSSGPL